MLIRYYHGFLQVQGVEVEQFKGTDTFYLSVLTLNGERFDLGVGTGTRIDMNQILDEVMYDHYHNGVYDFTHFTGTTD